MAYAEQKMSGNRLTAIVIVALIHIAVGYALVTGLAYEAASKIIKKVTTVDIKDEPKPPPPPPPPPQDKAPPPPIVAPPPPVNVSVAPPAITTVAVAPPAAPPAPVLAPPAPAAPPAPPAIKPVAATAKGDPSSWMSSDDYPTRAIREQRAGTVGFQVTIGPNGRATACTVTSSSGSPDLDDTACKLVISRGRFSPPKDEHGQPTTGAWNSRFKWQLPKD